MEPTVNIITIIDLGKCRYAQMKKHCASFQVLQSSQTFGLCPLSEALESFLSSPLKIRVMVL
jgi:hypothetical protein